MAFYDVRQSYPRHAGIGDQDIDLAMLIRQPQRLKIAGIVSEKLAEGMRFELTVRLDTVRRFSKPLPSATRPPLRRGRHCTAFAPSFYAL